MPISLPVDPNTAVLAVLLERVAVRDASALRMLYDLASPRLFAIALRISQRKEFAEEVLQDTFVNIWKFAADYRSDLSPPMAWMVVVVRNKTFDYLRRRKSFAGPEIEWSDTLDDVLSTETLDPYELAVAAQKTRHLAVCMSCLDANSRRALELAYFYDMTHVEVAQKMQAPLGTVKAWIRRATAALKISLSAYDEELPLASGRQTTKLPALLPVQTGPRERRPRVVCQTRPEVIEVHA